MNTLFEQNGCNYEIQGDYQLPCIATKKQNELYIGVWAKRHKQYLKQHHRIKYYNLLTSERLYPYLADIEEQAEAIFSRLVKSLAEKENVTEKLKADNPMLWVRDLWTRFAIGRLMISLLCISVYQAKIRTRTGSLWLCGIKYIDS